MVRLKSLDSACRSQHRRRHRSCKTTVLPFNSSSNIEDLRREF